MNELDKAHARIAELESQLAQRFDASHGQAPAQQPAPGREGEREAFEEWAKARGYQRDELARSKLALVSPEYFNPNTESTWQAWQARAAQAPAVPAVGVSGPLMGGYSAADMASQGAEQFRAGQASMLLAALEDAHRLGFWRAAIWADRDDLIADTRSPAYIKNRATDLAALAGTAPVSQEYAERVLENLDALLDDAAAHIYPSDLHKCMTSECAVEVASVRMGSPSESTVPLFSREQVAEALADATHALRMGRRL